MTFGPEAQSPDKRKGDRAEAGRPKGNVMHSIALDEALSNVIPGPSHAAKKAKAAAIERDRMRRWLDERISAGRSVEIVTLTPILAELLLERNTHNRPQAKSNITTLARDNAEGRFYFNGESLSVTASGVLGDGQHRCEMVVLTGKPVEVVMVFGIEDEAVKTINLGQSRTAANILAMDGTPDSNAVSTVANLIWQWKTFGRLAFSSAERPTKTQVIDAFAHYPGIAESVEFCKRKRSRLVASRTVLAFCHWAFAERAGREMADVFIMKLIDGDRPRDSDPIVYVRDRLMGIKGWVFPQVRASLIFQAWNLWRKGKTVSRLHANNNTLPQLER